MMIWFELSLCGLCLASASSILLRLIPQQWVLPLLLVTLALMVCHALVTSWRWQMWPAWAVLVAAIILFIVETNPGAWLQTTAMVIITLLTAISVLLVIGAPLVQLPAPDGPYAVGSVSHSTIDTGRTSNLLSHRDGRALFVKIWYPAAGNTASAQFELESLWQDVQSSDGIPGFLKYLTRYLAKVKTHSVAGAPLEPSVQHPKVLIYNHGMISFASENTLLMEHLASHGYVVMAIQHLEQAAEFRALNATVTEETRKRDADIMNRLRGELTRQQRAEITREWLQAAETTPQVVAGRTTDSVHVLDHLDEILASVPQLDTSVPVRPCIGAFGLSLGGATATQLSKTDERISAVVNLDGGLFGARMNDPITVPYLMMYSAGNEGGNDLLLANASNKLEHFTLPDSMHTDFHDASLLMPLLRWFNITSSPNPAATIKLRNTQVRQFFDAHLRCANGNSVVEP